MGLGLPVERPAVLAGGRLPTHGRRKSVGDEPPPHPLDGGGAHVECAGDLLVAPGRAAGSFVRLQDDPCVREFSRRAVAGGDPPMQALALRFREVDAMLLFHTAPAA